MTTPLLTFAVRTKSSADLNEIGSQVEKILNCTFSPANPDRYEEVLAIETEVLGLEVTLACWPISPMSMSRIYQVSGYPLKDILPEPEQVIDISEFILKVLNTRGEDQWYIPSLDELRTDLKLD